MVNVPPAGPDATQPRQTQRANARALERSPTIGSGNMRRRLITRIRRSPGTLSMNAHPLMHATGRSRTTFSEISAASITSTTSAASL